MKVRDAVRVSMSVPLYFEAVFLDSLGNVLQEQPATGYYNVAVDGGLTANFPIDLFDSVYLEGGRAYRIANPHTLGVRIDSEPQIEADKQQIGLARPGLAEQPIDGLPDYLQAFYTYVLENLNRPHLTPR
jgi:NTE family protein